MIKLYNTLGRKIKKFKPIKEKTVSLYTCGPTVYNFAHIGNLRAYIFVDVLKRTLFYNGYKIKHIMNITDVGHLTSDADDGEDKMEKGARREKKSVWDIAKFYTNAFKTDLKKLHILLPNKFVTATETIKDQINLIKILEKKGFTYKISDGIYFDTSRMPDYGKLANLDKQDLKAGARVALNKEKRNNTDFALWKFSPKNKKRQMEWESPWEIGFPGWHIECSAISTKYLGQPFDIHTGGIDHIGTHHTNEIAQSEGAYEKPLANFWIHSEFVTIKKGKMAKSKENFITLKTLQEKGIEPEAYRLLVLQTHYMHRLDFSWESIQATQNSFNTIKTILNQKSKIKSQKYNLKLKILLNDFKKAINDNLDTPRAMAIFFEVLKTNNLNAVLLMDRVLGLGLDKIKKQKIVIPIEIKNLAKSRDNLRKQKKWDESDKIRKQIEKKGFTIEDTDKKTVIR
ncbi:MAG: cysteine--tRNA ligase [Patescibacteria group bacterium]